MGELKLESISLRKDPSFMFAIIRNYIDQPDLNPDTLKAREQGLRAEAESEAFTAIKRRSGAWKLSRFKRTLNHFRQGVKNRENMRLARTRMFGLFRDIYLEIGQQLAVQNILNEARDVFYLTVAELKAYEAGTSVNTDLKGITAVRKAEFAAYEQDTPPNHLETQGAVYPLTFGPEEVRHFEGNTLKGLGCYPGVVQGPIRLIFSPTDELTVNNRILCTVRTDPGWAPLFPTCSGIIVERGSTLSHSAVVARELGIPAIVGVPGVTTILKDGDEVQMNGATGLIEIINKHEAN
jgi:pyruvate,water dikinase